MPAAVASQPIDAYPGRNRPPLSQHGAHAPIMRRLAMLVLLDAVPPRRAPCRHWSGGGVPTTCPRGGLSRTVPYTLQGPVAPWSAVPFSWLVDSHGHVTRKHLVVNMTVQKRRIEGGNDPWLRPRRGIPERGSRITPPLLQDTAAPRHCGESALYFAASH